MTDPAPQRVHPRAAFQHPDFRLFQSARFLGMIGWQMQSVAVGWQVYDITQSKLHLGYVGLATFLPSFLLTLVTGHTADRFDRKRIMVICQAVICLCAAALAWLSWSGLRSVAPIYAVLVVIGTARAFSGPAGQALMPSLVPPEHFSNAVAWNSSVWQFSMILGPATGGLLYGTAGKLLQSESAGAAMVYAVDALLAALCVTMLSRVRPRPLKKRDSEVTWDSVLAGFRYVWRNKPVLGAISMDLFAVLLGGATALLPVYARDILHVGTFGLGVLRGAPAIGAAVMAVTVAHMPPMRHAGATMLACVAGFGVATIVFGLSTSFWVSMVALVVLGACDMVSVVVRHTLVQLLTPPEMRGRVSAVNLVFIGASNELGEFESGVTAHFFGMIPAVATGALLARGASPANGAVVAVIVGGLGTLLVVALWARYFPTLRRFGRLDLTEQELAKAREEESEKHGAA